MVHNNLMKYKLAIKNNLFVKLKQINAYFNAHIKDPLCARKFSLGINKFIKINFK